MESIVKWKTGLPKEWSTYLVTTTEGTVAVCSFYPESIVDVEYFKTCIVAWCKLCDIQAYIKPNN